MTSDQYESLFVLCALVRASGGSMSRVDAARGMILLFTPSLMLGRAPKELKRRVKRWHVHAPSRVCGAHLFTRAERQLLDAGMLERVVDDGHLSLKATTTAWCRDQLGQSHMEEAELALEVIEAMT